MTRTRSARRIRWEPLLIVLGALACRKGGGGDADDAGGAGEKAVPAVVTATTAPVTRGPFARTLSAIGVVTPRPGHYAALGAPTAARIANVYVAAGARVAPGTPLIAFEAGALTAQAGAADAALEAAQRTAERTHRLVSEGISPRKDADQADAELAQARAVAVAARRTAQLSTLRAPIGGVVTRLGANIGATADPAQTLVEIADPSAFDVVLSMTPDQAAQVHPGAAVTLTGGEGANTAPVGDGVVAGVSAAVDTSTRAVNVRVRVTSPRRPLRLGETIAGEVTTQTDANALSVPIDALVPGDSGAFQVFVVDAKGIAQSKPVTVGARNHTRAEILDGVAAGDRVVTGGAFGVTDSARVTAPVPAGGEAKKDVKEAP